MRLQGPHGRCGMRMRSRCHHRTARYALPRRLHWRFPVRTAQYAYASVRVRPASVDVPYVRDRIKAADLHGNGLKDVAFEVVVRLSSMVGNKALDRLEAIGRWRGGDDVLLQQRRPLVFILRLIVRYGRLRRGWLRLRAGLWCRRWRLTSSRRCGCGRRKLRRRGLRQRCDGRRSRRCRDRFTGQNLPAFFGVDDFEGERVIDDTEQVGHLADQFVWTRWMLKLPGVPSKTARTSGTVWRNQHPPARLRRGPPKFWRPPAASRSVARPGGAPALHKERSGSPAAGTGWPPACD